MDFKRALFIFSFIFILIALTAISGYAYISSCNYEEHSRALTDKLHLMDKVKYHSKKALEIASFGIYRGYSEDINELKNIIQLSEFYKNQANRATILFFSLIFLFLLLLYIFHRDQRTTTLALLYISFVCLIFGLIAPILRIITYKDIPLLGYTVFQFQSKAIFTSIQELFTSNNRIVALLILLFSVLIPIAKTIVMAAISLRLDLFAHQKILTVIKHIGKWSMADVFVVALLLAYFGLDKEGFTDAELQIGLYFFVGYVILSMITSHLITHSDSLELQ
jgi:paraquat-inducible protein A